ncbi:MAG: LLM class flavin-dependent oxidoreductase [Pseudomonadales bacterium]|nr:LLM class flavin-dependent oxidoreductase [Pseudomonadales bacterium]
MTTPTNPPRLGYLLPTRENVMRGEHGVRNLLDAARIARGLGFDSLWVGDSLFARPRHDPLTLLGAVAVAAPGATLGTAVLLSALRNPVVLAQQLATLDQICEGRLVIGAGIGADAPPVRAEFAAASVPFERRVGRLVEGFALCRALWRGEPVTWEGRWQLQDVTLGPQPHRPGGPLIWLASNVDAGVERAARLFDGWFPIGPDAATIAARHTLLLAAASEHRRPPATTAVYLTVCIDTPDNNPEAQIDAYLAEYYGVPAPAMRRVQACKGGDTEAVMEWLQAFVRAGADHLVLRLVGNHQRALAALAEQRHLLG